MKDCCKVGDEEPNSKREKRFNSVIYILLFAMLIGLAIMDYMN